MRRPLIKYLRMLARIAIPSVAMIATDASAGTCNGAVDVLCTYQHCSTRYEPDPNDNGTLKPVTHCEDVTCGVWSPNVTAQTCLAGGARADDLLSTAMREATLPSCTDMSRS